MNNHDKRWLAGYENWQFCRKEKGRTENRGRSRTAEIEAYHNSCFGESQACLHYLRVEKNKSVLLSQANVLYFRASKGVQTSSHV